MSIRNTHHYSFILKELIELKKINIEPKKLPNKLFYLYSLPAFDNNKQPEILLGRSIKSNKYLVFNNTILFSKLNLKFKRVWKINRITENNSICSTEFLPIKIKSNNKNVNFDFLYYFLISNDFINKLEKQACGTSSSHQRIKVDSIFSEIVNLPPFLEQKQIATILSSLDDKIELNNQINKNLEQIAQAIFKHWFIDFEFPDENGHPYKSNGGEMVDSELGQIPKGWRVKELKSISDIQNGFAFKSKDYTKKGIKVIRTLNINNRGFVENNNLKYLPKEFYNNKKYYKCKLEKFDTLLVMVGASLGKLGMITNQNLPSLQNQNMWRFRPKINNISSPFIYYTVRRCNKIAIGWATGSAREFYRKDIFGKIKCIQPKNKDLERFNILSLKIFTKIEFNLFQNQILQELRDTLLPKLMSGEIRVPINDKEGDK